MCYLVRANKYMPGRRDEYVSTCVIITTEPEKAHRRTSSNVTSIITTLKMRMPEVAQRDVTSKCLSYTTE
jgi:hypothetical protein